MHCPACNALCAQLATAAGEAYYQCPAFDDGSDEPHVGGGPPRRPTQRGYALDEVNQVDRFKPERIAGYGHTAIMKKPEVYVCPFCFAAAQARHASGHVVQVLRKLDRRRELPFVAFRKATHLKQHIRIFHNAAAFSAPDNTVRAINNKTVATRNAQAFNSGRHHEVQQVAVTYWKENGHANAHSYNELLAIVEARCHERGFNVLGHCVFPDADVEDEDDEEDASEDDEEGATDEEADGVTDDGPDDDSDALRGRHRRRCR
jgi:hypothetical protein